MPLGVPRVLGIGGHADEGLEGGDEDAAGVVDIEPGELDFGVGVRVVLDQRLHGALGDLLAAGLELGQLVLADPHGVNLLGEVVEVGLQVLLDQLVLVLEHPLQLVLVLALGRQVRCGSGE